MTDKDCALHQTGHVSLYYIHAPKTHSRLANVCSHYHEISGPIGYWGVRIHASERVTLLVTTHGQTHLDFLQKTSFRSF